MTDPRFHPSPSEPLPARLFYQFYPSPVGTLFLAETDVGPAAVLFARGEIEAGFEREFDYLETAYPDLSLSEAPCIELSVQLDAYFRGEDARVPVPSYLVGSEFERAVWREIAMVPFGELISYGEIARRLDRPGGAQAVGLATGRNPISILIPCHRVVGSRGELTGYGGGLERKRWLLDHERPTLFRGAGSVS